jgi:hypothetical protein
MTGKRCAHVGTSLLSWMGYERSDRENKQRFIDLLGIVIKEVQNNQKMNFLALLKYK